MLISILAAALVSAAPPVDYRDPANWLCRPNRKDACALDPVRSVVSPDGSMRTERVTAAKAPLADCFYVYPTVSNDPTPNSDLIPGPEELGVAASQLAIFSTVCRTFAPMYRQVTLTSLHAGLAKPPPSMTKSTGAPMRPDPNLGYEDVKAAWHDYLQNDNHGRPFVLIGHSQGSSLLKRLVSEEIDGKPLANRLVAAVLPGSNISVPKGKDVGGSFKALPLCRKDTQTGCIIVWVSYRDTSPPPQNALFGRSRDPAMEWGCTNPARLAGGETQLDSVVGYPRFKDGVALYEPISAGQDGSSPSPPRFIRAAGMLSAKCVSTDGLSYLSVHVNPRADGGFTAGITDPAVVGDTTYPEWGWHVMDMAIVQADLVALVGRQVQAWASDKKAEGH